MAVLITGVLRSLQWLAITRLLSLPMMEPLTRLLSLMAQVRFRGALLLQRHTGQIPLCNSMMEGLPWGQMQDNRPAERIAQRMDFCRAASARAADGLIVLPPFPPEAHR